MIDRRLLRNLDHTVLVTVLLLVAFGLAMVYSATHASQADSLLTVKKQLVGVVLGFLGLTLIVLVDYHVSERLHLLVYLGNLLLLGAVLVFGKEVHGAKSWFAFGPFSFQPSEFAKVAVIVTLARHLDKKESLSSFWDLLGPLAHVAAPLGLIMLQPDLGTALVFVFITFSMLYMAGARGRHLALLGGVPLLVFAALIFAHLRYGLPLPLKEYQLKRLTSFIDPARDAQGAGYNLLQAMIAIGSGRFLGKGYLRGTQGRLGYVPEHQTDFIFTIVGEELGFLGGFVLLALFFTLIWRGLRIAYQAKDRYGRLLATGVLAMFLFHVMENIGMNLGIMPITGIPLPFISAGASSMTANLWAVGILENVWARRQKIMF
ncbi:MAG: rod shape-determining protein RodA [Firmicutes bacterium]|nr:rod shape-determining protein RodA [Bacillota bacterium]